VRGKYISSGEIRDIIAATALEKLVALTEYGDWYALEDSYASIMILGPPGVGKSSLQYLAIKDVAELLSEQRGKKIGVVKVSLRVSHERASELANKVVKGEVIPYVHLYLPQTKLWHLEGTPSPMDQYVEVAGRRIPYNLWRLDPFLIPLLDYTDIATPENAVTPLLVLDEFNMGRKDVREALFQLARSAELGKAKLNPLTIITLLGNPPEENVYAEDELPAPLVNRAERYIINRVTVDGWIAFMNEVYGKKWAQEVGGFLTVSPKHIYIRDPTDPETVTTPRTWTQLAVGLHVLKRMVGRGLLPRGDYWRHVDRKIHSLLVPDVADEFYAFLRGLAAVNIDDIIRNPEKIASMNKSVAAYTLVKIVSREMEAYKRAGRERREEILRRLASVMSHARRVLGAEAVGIVVSSLPAPVRIRFARVLPESERQAISEMRRKVKELEDTLQF